MANHILIVEDDQLISRMYQQIFTLEKLTVAVAVDGQDAWEKIQVDKPILILLDVMMPRLNGFQLLDLLKGNPNTKDIPVIMLTNLASDQESETALSKGALKYIVKSQYDPKSVLEMVKEVLANSSPVVATA